jgi:hypothetical protein
MSRLYYTTHYLLKIYNNTVYRQPCQHSREILVPSVVPIIKNEDFILFAMAIIAFLSSSTTSDQSKIPLLRALIHGRTSITVCQSHC